MITENITSKYLHLPIKTYSIDMIFVGIEVGAGRDGKATMTAEIMMTENIPPGDGAGVGAEAETTTAAAPEATMTTMMTMISIVTGKTEGGEIIECRGTVICNVTII